MAPFASVLIANRGEIACRVIRTARAMGMRTVAVYSQADAAALHVAMADTAVPIGPAPARDSYLVIDKIIAAARETGAEAIHPGYGFLSERAEFAEACAAAGIAFVGPPASAIRAMGLKDGAKALMQKAGVPIVPGYHGETQEPGFLAERAAEIGFPVLIKAVAGGGGKGMKRVDEAADFRAALESAQREAANAFGDPRVLIEKYVTAPRHVEMQVFADRHGNVVHLFERDCSLQRRHQKVIEEAPAPGMTPEARAAMGKAAVEAARAVGYVGAGTVEFIVDGSRGLAPDSFWFMEMNTRLQVEHPVTEAITGLDLVALQFKVAAGETLPFVQEDLKIDGHAVEARIYAEDPENGFLPSTGTLHALRFPQGEGIRVDTGVEEGAAITPFYDPMIFKLIAHAGDRTTALARLAEALGDTVVAGPRSNVAFLKALAEAPAFIAGDFDTGFIDRNLAALGAVKREASRAAVAAGAAALADQAARRAADRALAAGAPAQSPWALADAFQLGPSRRLKVPVTVDGQPADAVLAWRDGRAAPAEGAAPVSVIPAAGGIYVIDEGRSAFVTARRHDITGGEGGGEGAIRAPMHGKLLALFVAEGETVARGQRIAIVEAMKMEHALVAGRDGVIGRIAAAAGDQVGEGALIATIEAEAAA